jgi:hypothetical protein
MLHQIQISSSPKQTRLRDDLLQHSCRELIGEPFLEPVTLQSQIAMIESQQVQHRCMQVMNTDSILCPP